MISADETNAGSRDGQRVGGGRGGTFLNLRDAHKLTREQRAARQYTVNVHRLAGRCDAMARLELRAVR